MNQGPTLALRPYKPFALVLQAPRRDSTSHFFPMALYQVVKVRVEETGPMFRLSLHDRTSERNAPIRSQRAGRSGRNLVNPDTGSIW